MQSLLTEMHHNNQLQFGILFFSDALDGSEILALVGWMRTDGTSPLKILISANTLLPYRRRVTVPCERLTQTEWPRVFKVTSSLIHYSL